MSKWTLVKPIDELVGSAHADLIINAGTYEARCVHVQGSLAAVTELVVLACETSTPVASSEGAERTVWRIVISGGGGAIAAMLFEAPAEKQGELTLEDINAIEQNASQILKCDAVALSWAKLTTTSVAAEPETDTACDPISPEGEIAPAPRDTVEAPPAERDGTLPFTPRHP